MIDEMVLTCVNNAIGKRTGNINKSTVNFKKRAPGTKFAPFFFLERAWTSHNLKTGTKRALD